MTALENKKLIHRFYTEVVGKGDFSRLREIIASDYVDHNATKPGDGPAIVQTQVEAMRKTFPDFHVTIDELIAEGECVVSRVTAHGTHLGEWMGIAPQGNVVRFSGINMDRVQDGRIAEHWGEADTVGMLQQLGVNVFSSIAAARPEQSLDEILRLERAFWTADVHFYQLHLSDDALLVFPEPVGVMNKVQTLESILDGPRWRDVEFENVRTVEPIQSTVILTYKARAHRGLGEPEHVTLATSAYTNKDGTWRLTFHQQSAAT